MAEGFRKKKKECSPSQEDRISGLPDSLIHHILSFLEMKDVIRTCLLLSRRWMHLWTSVPVLDFGQWWSDDPTFIDQSLLLCEGQKIQRFHVDLIGEVDECHINSWIRFTARHGVEELDIRFYCRTPLYKFSCHLLDCEALRVLKLGYCVLNLSASICFRSLKELHLCYVEFTNLDTSGCPLLEYLIIEACNDDISIYAPNKKLRYLKYMFMRNCWRNSGLTIFAPFLLSIELGRDFRQSYNFTNLSSIVSASLDFSSKIIYLRDSCNAQLLVGLLKKLSHAKTLKLCQRCVKMLAYRESENLKTPDLSATCLELESNLTKSALPGIASLLRSCDCLETLIINVAYCQLVKDHDNGHFDALKSWKMLELALSAPLQLKNVKINNFLHSESHWLYEPLPILNMDEPVPILNIDEFLENWAKEIKLVKIILERCKMLDKMIISTIKMPRWSLKSELLLRLMKKLLAFPRASASAEICFTWK